MKNHNKYMNCFFVVMVAVMGFSVAACEDEPDKYEVASGTPTIKYVRMTPPAVADSLITGAYMGNTVCLVGDNLRSIKKMYFNDQPAILNSSYMTDHTLIVDVPNKLSDNPTDKIYMYNSKDEVTEYDFAVLVPGPSALSMSCEYAKEGEIAEIYGDYLLSYETNPIKVTFAGNVEAEVISADKTSVKFRVPEGASEGNINVSTKYGTTQSKFHYLDSRGIILDMDNTTAAGSWSPGVYKNTEPDGIDGNYQCFEGTATSWGTWNAAFFFHYWGKNDVSDLEPADAVLKFEVNCVKPWLGIPLYMQFEPEVTAERNPYLTDADPQMVQCHWKPFEATGSYQTDGWVTVTIPFSEFKYDTNETVANLKLTSFSGMKTFFMGLYGALPEGVDKNDVQICIDNVRIVPKD